MKINMCLTLDYHCPRGYSDGSCAVLDCPNNKSNPENTEKHRPRIGDKVKYLTTNEIFTVSRLEGSICHTVTERGEPSSFIWRFRDGLNSKHIWGSK